MARRPKGEGTYEQRGGKYRHIRTQDGKRQTGPWEPSKRDALNSWQLRFMAPADGRNDAGNLPINRLVSQLFTEDGEPAHPIARRLAARWSPSTLDAWRLHLLSIAKRKIGLYSLDDLPAEVLQNWVGLYRARTAANYLADLTNLARECGVTLPPVRLPRRQVREYPVLLPADFSKVLNLARDDSDRLMLGLLYYGGFRISELCALKSDSWNPDTGEFAVTRSAIQTKGKVTIREATKTGRVRRVPIVAPWLVEILDSMPVGFVLSGESHPVSPMSARRRLWRILQGSPYAKISPQGFRRSAATAYALSGVPIHLAAQILGHSSRMLTEVYAQYNPGARMSAAKQAFGNSE